MGAQEVDPITLEVIRNRLDNIADEMEMILLKSAYSSIIKEALDASAAIFDWQGRTLAQAASIPGQLGMLPEVISSIIATCSKEKMFDGDVFILNDPYEGGTHLPDISIMIPVFYQGKIVAFSGSFGHHQDVGGIAPGSVSPEATEIFAEGLRIPILKLYEKGEPNKTLMELIRKNVRIPDIVMGDIRAQIACANAGKRRIVALFDEYGVGTVTLAIEKLMDHAEKLVRKCIEEISDGTSTFYDFIDDDGIEIHKPIKLMVTVTIKGSNIHFDFTGSSPQVKGPINSVPSGTKSIIYYIIKAITGSDIPNNDGCYRPITMNLPEGSIVNPKPPAACGVRTVTLKRLVDILFGALVRLIPNKIPAASNGQLAALVYGGMDPETGKNYVFLSAGIPTTGGMGARPNKDGVDVLETDISNLLTQPIEPSEINFPIRINKLRLWRDSGGAGKYRGGLGYESECELTRGEATFCHRRDRHDFAPWGLFGGMAAPTCKTTLYRKDGRKEELPSKIVTQMKAGDRIHIFTTGGGGYGDPLEREPEKVLEDVLEGRISSESAYEIYGVVIDGNTKAVDMEKTKIRRMGLAKQRGPITWIFDRGGEYEKKTGESSRHC